MFSDVLSLVSLLRVCVENALHEISTAVTYEFGDEEVATENLFVEFGCVGVFEGKVAADKSKEDDACRPDVHVGSVVLLAGNHFRSCVARGATGSFEELTSFVCV